MKSAARIVRSHPRILFVIIAFGWAWACWIPIMNTDISDMLALGPRGSAGTGRISAGGAG